MAENATEYGILFLGVECLFFAQSMYYKSEESCPVNSDVKHILAVNCYACNTGTSNNPDTTGFTFFNHFNELQYLAIQSSATNLNYRVLIARM